MAKTVSTYPKISDIHLCTAAGHNMTKKIYTAANGRFTTKVGMKQPTSLPYGYQVQYRHCSRYTLANEAAKGATWTETSPWKNDRAFVQNGTTYAVGSTFPVSKWQKCNIGVNKSSAYHAFDSFNNSYVGGDYDCRWYQYRVRTYNPQNNAAGDWFISNGLYIYKAADVRDVYLYRGLDGELVIRCNYNFDRGVTLTLDGLVKGSGDNMARSGQTAYSIDTDNARGSLLPAARTGYMPGIVRIPASAFSNAEIERGETYELTAHVRTTDGAITSISGTYTVQPDDELINKPAVTVADNGMNFGIPRVTVTRSDTADIVTKYGCTGSYVSVTDSKLSGKVVIKPTKVTEYNKGAANWYVVYEFANAPVGVDITFSATFANAAGSSATRSVVYANDTAPGTWYLNKADDLGKRASLQYNVRFNAKTAKPFTLEQPHGRAKPWVAYGIGNRTDMSLSGVIVGDDEAPSGMLNTSNWASWKWVQRNQGVYLLRAPKGRVFNVAVTDVTINAASDKAYDVTLSLVEVE